MFNVKVEFSLLLLLAALCFSAAEPLAAQEQPPAWAQQQRIPGYSDRTEPPILVVDPTGTVHAFAYQQVGDPDDHSQIAIIHSTWTYERGWTLPNDIILSPIRNQARVMDVHMDSNGMFHLVFYGGDEEGANIYYSTAPVREAGAAPAWSVPVVVGQYALTPSLARISGDDNGNMVVVYNGNLDGPGLFQVWSSDNGETWGKPMPFFLTYNRIHRPATMAISWGHANKLHLVWRIVDERGYNMGGYYAQVDFSTREWTEAISIDEGIGVERGMGVADPSVIEHNGQVIVVYNNGIPPDGVPPTMWSIFSEDDGQTWSDRIRISGNHVGRNGPASFVVDSLGQLHVFYGMRMPFAGSAIHGMWHAVWQDSRWTESAPVVSGLQSSRFDPSRPSAIAVDGNKLLVVWFTDPGLQHRGVWYSVTELDMPMLPRQQIPEATNTLETVDSDSTENLTSHELEVEIENSRDNVGLVDQPLLESNPGSPILISSASVMGLLMIIFAGRIFFFRKSRRHNS